jgi:hypothetical protein
VIPVVLLATFKAAMEVGAMRLRQQLEAAPQA